MASIPTPKLKNPPIVEAVFDIDCDLPIGLSLGGLEGASREKFQDRYPKFRTLMVQEHQLAIAMDAPAHLSSRSAAQALQFLQEDERQLVQVRANGFSFNRLAPYISLDDYLPEIERTWRLYVDLVSPVQIRVVRLRYINRILLPLSANTVDLDEFLKIGSRLPDMEGLVLSGFLSQVAAMEKDTKHRLDIVTTAQPQVNDKLPVILDITVASLVTTEGTGWPLIMPIIASLRSLKNRTFANTLTRKCIQLFQS
jgi:uncharacterized protein (TIGR04255 family)